MIESIFTNPTKKTNQQFLGKVYTLLVIILFLLLVALHQYFERYTLGCFPSTHEHWSTIMELIFSVVLGGILGGTALVFLWDKWLRNMSFIRALLYIFLWVLGVYILINTTIITLIILFDPGQLETQNVIRESFVEITKDNAMVNFFFWFVIIMLTLGVLLVRDKFGPRVFYAFLLGKYFRPRKEERIFMFMDLKSSTSIAERLGEAQYFKFLNDSFSTAIPGIMDTRGEIYQYVGDEIVVSWDLSSGLKWANCIRCFYEMNNRLKARYEYFDSTYGIRPEFKAGIHSGHVIAGEMGIIKRELVYSGDVLNTAARIQSKCNEFKVNILISKVLMDQIDSSELKVKINNLGKILLRGKVNQVEVVTL